MWCSSAFLCVVANLGMNVRCITRLCTAWVEEQYTAAGANIMSRNGLLILPLNYFIFSFNSTHAYGTTHQGYLRAQSLIVWCWRSCSSYHWSLCSKRMIEFGLITFQVNTRSGIISSYCTYLVFLVSYSSIIDILCCQNILSDNNLIEPWTKPSLAPCNP